MTLTHLRNQLDAFENYPQFPFRDDEAFGVPGVPETMIPFGAEQLGLPPQDAPHQDEGERFEKES
jgi:hypothetical protein